MLVDLFVEAHERAPREIVIDLDNTNVPLYGMQEGRFFHGYYDDYCYLPLYAFCGRHLLLARQRRANVAGSAGAVEEVARIVARIRRKWRKVRIVLRANSGFANEELMAWCEANRVGYVFGLARNSRLEAALGNQAAEAKRLCIASGRSARVFRDFRYRTLDSWSRERRVVGKAEHTPDGANPRFVVTSLRHARLADPRPLFTRACTAPAARRRTASASSSNCSPIAPPPPPWRPTSCACGSRPWPMCWSTRYAVSVCALPSSPTPRRRPFVSGSSSLALRCAPVYDASTSRSPRAAPTRPSSNWLTSIYSVRSAPPDGHHAEMPRIDPSSHDTRRHTHALSEEHRHQTRRARTRCQPKGCAPVERPQQRKSGRQHAAQRTKASKV